LSKRERPKPARRARIAPETHGRSLRQADERAERLTTLSRLTRLITSATDSAAAFHGIAEAATNLLKAKMAYVWVDHGAETLREGGSFWAGPTLVGHIVPTVPVPRDQSIAGAVLTSCRPEYLEDVQRDPRWRHRALAETSDIHACIALPLIHHERAVGALIVGFGRRGDFTPEEKNLAGLLADQAAIAIENARLYEDAGRRQREAELLADVVRSVNASLDLATVLQRIAEGAREVCRSDMAFIALRDPGRDTLSFRQWPGAHYEDYRSVRVAPGQGASGMVLATGLHLLYVAGRYRSLEQLRPLPLFEVSETVAILANNLFGGAEFLEIGADFLVSAAKIGNVAHNGDHAGTDSIGAIGGSADGFKQDFFAFHHVDQGKVAGGVGSADNHG